MHPDLTLLEHVDELHRLIDESQYRPVLLFKHSHSCGARFETAAVRDGDGANPPRHIERRRTAARRASRDAAGAAHSGWPRGVERITLPCDSRGSRGCDQESILIRTGYFVPP